MEEILQRFVVWAKLKIRIHLSERIIYFREGEVWWVNLGLNIGHEQDGKDEQFMRPILVLKKFNADLLWAIPLSSQIKEANKYYYKYSLDGKEYSAVLSQLRTLSSKRLIRKIAVMAEDDYKKIKAGVKNLL